MTLPELPPDTAPALRTAFEALARESAELRAELEALKRELAPRRATATAQAGVTAVADPVAPSGAAAPPRPAPLTEFQSPDRRRELARDAIGLRSAIAPNPRPAAHVDMEKLLGRYGAWAAAALMILLGVGTLLEWAIRNGLFGPVARVALSTVTAVALAVGGYVLRERAGAAGESRGFGNACLGLALGVVDVIAWEIGPHWQMVPTALALLLADVGAAALVTFGVREEDELLAAVGAAGLYLAPFVTSSGDGSPVVLASYITIVSLALFRFAELEAWRVARGVIRWGSLLSVLALVAMGEPVLATLVASVLALAMLGIDASVVQRLGAVALYVVAAIVATFAASPAAHPALGVAQATGRHTAWIASIAVTLTMIVVSAYVLRATTPYTADGDRPDAVLRPGSALSLALTLLLPVGAVLAAATALPGDATLNVLAMSEGAGVIALAVALWSDAPRAREYFTTGFVLLWTGALTYSSRGAQVPEAMLLGIAAVGIVIATLRRDVTVARFAAFMSAACVALVSASRMYTAESQPVPGAPLDILLMTGAFCALVLTARQHVDGERSETHVIRVLAAWIAGLLLARHLVVLVSGPYAAVTLTAFYAATGVALIILGGRRESLGMRRAGLGVSLYAPLRAIVTASDVDNTGIRVAVYFVAGAFMLLVAFLYRSRGREAEPILADVLTPQ